MAGKKTKGPSFGKQEKADKAAAGDLKPSKGATTGPGKKKGKC